LVFRVLVRLACFIGCAHLEALHAMQESFWHSSFSQPGINSSSAQLIVTALWNALMSHMQWLQPTPQAEQL